MKTFEVTKKEIKKTSIGEQLKKRRLEKGISYEAAEEATKIKIKYLKALEEDDFEAFPSLVYALGFIKSYCKYLGIPSGPIIEQYKKELGKIKSTSASPFPSKKGIPRPKFYITSTTLFIFFLAAVVLGVLFYIGYQVSGFAGAPYLLIESPNYGAVVTQDSVIVEGKTSRGANLFINGQQLPIDSSGKFKQEVKLKEGENRLFISASNRAGKKTEKELLIIFKTEGI